MELTWMAWTWPTAAFFGFIAVCLISMTIWELAVPGGNPCSAPGSLDTSLSHAAGLIEIAACHA